MGFVLFNASGTFSPLDYGLNTGDTIQVVVVGGGGGGGCNGGAAYSGGSGGTSSFGSYATAAGGGGGRCGGASGYPSQSTVGMYMGGMGTTAGGGGAGGWIPGVIDWGGNGGSGIALSYGGATTQVPTEIKVYGANGTAGTGGVYVSASYTLYYNSSGSSTTAYCANVCLIGQSKYSALPRCQYYYNGVTIFANPSTGLYFGGGGGWLCTNAGSYYTNYGIYMCSGSGGSGYGAGGGGSYNGNGGNSGVVVTKTITLTSTASIAVGVGGGGQGAYSYYDYDLGLVAVSGASGSTGARGGSTYGYGGYAGVPGVTYAASNAPSSYSYGGGGAGGCVAVFW